MIIKNHKLIALIFLIISLINLALSFYELYPPAIIWFCSATIWLFIIGIYFKNDFLISSTVTASFVIETLWLIDYTSFLFLGRLTIGMGEYLLTSSTARIIVTSYHLIILIVPILTIFELKRFNKYSWLGASLYFFLISIITLLIANPNANLNCVFRTCQLPFNILEGLNQFLLIYLPPFIIHWLFMTLVIFIPTHFFFKKIINWIKK